MITRKQLGIALATISLLTLNSVFAQEPVWDGNKVELVSEKLDDGVFAYYPSDAKARPSGEGGAGGRTPHFRHAAREAHAHVQH